VLNHRRFYGVVLENMQEAILTSLHVLVVDEDSVALGKLTGMLQSLGVSKVTSARNGSDALTKIASTQRAFDCILCELWMPYGNGLQLLKAIRTGQVGAARPDTCVIFVTTVTKPEPIKIASQLDANGYVVKPAVSERLRAAIAKGRSKSFKIDLNRYATAVVPESAL
jgi:CheY-like chemotaxis protein